MSRDDLVERERKGAQLTSAISGTAGANTRGSDLGGPFRRSWPGYRAGGPSMDPSPRFLAWTRSRWPSHLRMLKWCRSVSVGSTASRRRRRRSCRSVGTGSQVPDRRLPRRNRSTMTHRSVPLHCSQVHRPNSSTLGPGGGSRTLHRGRLGRDDPRAHAVAHAVTPAGRRPAATRRGFESLPTPPIERSRRCRHGSSQCRRRGVGQHGPQTLPREKSRVRSRRSPQPGQRAHFP